MSFEKAIKVFGSRLVFYERWMDAVTVLYPDTGEEEQMSKCKFEKSFCPYSTALPPAIREKLDAMPSHREWRRAREKKEARA